MIDLFGARGFQSDGTTQTLDDEIPPTLWTAKTRSFVDFLGWGRSGSLSVCNCQKGEDVSYSG